MAARLCAPTSAVRVSYLDAVAEYLHEGGYSDFAGWDITTPERFERYVATLRADPSDDHYVAGKAMTLLWWVAGDRYLGRLSIWHRLDADLVTTGHIGCDIRPSARGRGQATAMLAAAIPRAYRLGIDPALLTTHIANVASQTVIRRNGGHLIDQRGNRLYYELATHP